MMSTIEQYLLDTGILLRLVNRFDPDHVTVRDAVRVLRRGSSNLITSYQNLAEFWNVRNAPRHPESHRIRTTDRRRSALYSILPEIYHYCSGNVRLR